MRKIFTVLLCLLGTAISFGQQKNVQGKPISSDLFGIFFEDISYAADGGLYAELIQNRSFEYTPADRWGWHPFTNWEYTTDGFGYGNVSIESASPIHPNNPHYVVLDVQEAGQKGVGLINNGFDGISVSKRKKYRFSVFLKKIDGADPIVEIQLRGKKGQVYGTESFKNVKANWAKYEAEITSNTTDTAANLAILIQSKTKVALDVVSLFPEDTFNKHRNGLRGDIAESIAALKPKFMRFPGGCLAHGDGIANIYNWKNTVGPVETRKAQRNIWNYQQSGGLGYFEYFQFCEDIGAKPLPVIAAAVSCQNSGGTWRTGGTGQKAVAMEDMEAYIQDIIDLVEYANGAVTTTWGAKRAEAGHPKPFNLQYIGIGNEDKITPEFEERFKMIYDRVREKCPQITLIGTTGPFHSGEDYDKGWAFANALKIPMVDEHYYEDPKWFVANQQRYDQYDRSKSKIYIGEYASKGNTLFNALAEAAYMTAMERNGDVIHMASYAPLIANVKHTSWNPNLIYFDNNTVMHTANYYVQKMFSTHMGNLYYANVVAFKVHDSTLAASAVKDIAKNELILKLVNTGNAAAKFDLNLTGFKLKTNTAKCETLTGKAEDKNTFNETERISTKVSDFKINTKIAYTLAPNTFQVITVKLK